MRKVKKALLVTLPAAALLIGGGVGIAAAADGQPTAPMTAQVTSTVRQQQQAPDYGNQVLVRSQDRSQEQLRDGTCDPAEDQRQDRIRDRDQVHDPIQDRDRLHDRLTDR